MMRVLVAAAIAAGVVRAWDVARTPPMGFNTWNLFACGVSAAVLNDTAKSMHDSGLAAAGYEYVNSDDCWMLATRDASGKQIANPEKFPNGFSAVTSYIHSLGLKSGLYTAKGPNTCARFAASCNHEVQDAAQWAEWGIDYVKDDSCSTCPGFTDNEIYARMWAAIEASGRPMVLTVEGQPTDSIITHGGYGNAKRVGHDISPKWDSMTSLVDIGSGLWMYAHNSSDARYGGWWNDLDMIEVGNAPDFVCGADAASLNRCRAHFSMWAVMKSPLILGHDIPHQSAATLATLASKEAIAINQDALGIQAQRVAVSGSLDALFPTTSQHAHNTAIVARCDAARPTQAWRLAGGALSTVDAAGTRWCLRAERAEEGGFVAVPCPAGASDARASSSFSATPQPSGLVALRTGDGAGVAWSSAASASGPVPFSRYVTAGDAAWAVDLAAASAPAGAAFVAGDRAGIVGNDNVGGAPTLGGDFCLDLAAGLLEVWASPLTGGRYAVALFNRSPADAPITATFASFNATGSFDVYDVWAAAAQGAHTGSYTSTVATLSTTLLVLSPAA